MKPLGLLRLLFAAVFCLALQAGASTINVGPSDCSAAAVNAAVASAHDGDAVVLTCTGTVAWTATVAIPGNKGVSLVVLSGTNTPKISARFPLTVTSALTAPAVSITIGPNNSVSRLSGFKFQNSGTVGDTGLIRVSGNGMGKEGLGGFRIDNNYLDTISGQIIIAVHSNNGLLYGLIDNNTMHDAWRADGVDYGPYGIDFANWWNPGNSCWGEDGWTSSLNFGDKNWTFVEDNLFENVSAGKYMRHYFSAALGARYVSRYNTFIVNVRSPNGNRTDVMEGHGLCICHSTGCGTRGAEIYRNTISGTEIGRHIMPRGGSWLIYDNTFTDLGSYSSTIWLLEYRAGDSGMYSQCSSTCPCAAPLGFVWTPSVTDGSHYPLPQQISNSYIWNNLYRGVNQVPSVDSRGVQTAYLQAGRDYFVSVSKPTALSSYSPYTYPHPLRDSPPSEPKNFRMP